MSNTKFQTAPKQTEEAHALSPRANAKLNPLEINILEGSISDVEEESQRVVRDRLLAFITERVAAMSGHKLQDVARFITLTNNDQGCVTPAEQFIGSLVTGHFLYGLTPKNAAEELEDFRLNFEDALNIARRFNTTYARMLQASDESTGERG